MRIYTCCEPCLKKVKENPREALRMLTMMGEFPDFVDMEISHKNNDKKFKNNGILSLLRYGGGVFVLMGMVFLV